MKLAVVGSRTFNDMYLLAENVCIFISASEKPSGSNELEIISGGAKGADTLAKKCALINNLKYTEFLPDWNKFGKSAGFRRNQQIVDACDVVIAFWDGNSKGTQDTINKAKIAMKPTYIVYFRNEN